jgi:hypothetical protein
LACHTDVVAFCARMDDLLRKGLCMAKGQRVLANGDVLVHTPAIFVDGRVHTAATAPDRLLVSPPDR